MIEEGRNEECLREKDMREKYIGKYCVFCLTLITVATVRGPSNGHHLKLLIFPDNFPESNTSTRIGP